MQVSILRSSFVDTGSLFYKHFNGTQFFYISNPVAKATDLNLGKRLKFYIKNSNKKIQALRRDLYCNVMHWLLFISLENSFQKNGFYIPTSSFLSHKFINKKRHDVLHSDCK